MEIPRGIVVVNSYKKTKLTVIVNKSTGISYVCTGHCTKERAYNIMKEILTDMLEQLHVGLTMEF